MNYLGATQYIYDTLRNNDQLNGLQSVRIISICTGIIDGAYGNIPYQYGLLCGIVVGSTMMPYEWIEEVNTLFAREKNIQIVKALRDKFKSGVSGYTDAALIELYEQFLHATLFTAGDDSGFLQWIENPAREGISV